MTPSSSPARAELPRIGTAGWQIPAADRAAFPDEGSHLERYAARFSAVEINSSFYKPHRPSTYARWAASVPPAFRFSVKVPKVVTHEHALDGGVAELTRFLDESAELGDKLGVLLVQLPPSLAFDGKIAARFFARLEGRPVVCEPRHPSWFEAKADAMLVRAQVARVAADPARVPAAAVPGGWLGRTYHRLHGSPRTYYSSYDDAYLGHLASSLEPGAWCIFDNTALGAAATNALKLQSCMRTVPLSTE